MPFRRWFAARGVGHPAAYSMAVLALGVVVCMGVAVLISVQASDRAVRAERFARVEALDRERAAREEARMATCLVIGRMIDVYSDPSTPTGVAAREAWTDLGRIFHCQMG